MNSIKISLILGCIYTTNLSAQAPFVQLVPNAVCEDKEIPDNSHIDIDPLHLPSPCINYDPFEDVSFDLVFEDNFDFIK
jgi:hypothetical protein